MLQAFLVVFGQLPFESQVGSYLILSNFVLNDLKVSVLITGSKTKNLQLYQKVMLRKPIPVLGVKIFSSHWVSSISFVRSCADCFSTPTPSEVSSFILASSNFVKDQILGLLHNKRRYLDSLSHERNAG